MDRSLSPVRLLLVVGLIAAASPEVAVDSPVSALRCSGGVTSIELVEHASYDAIFHNASAVAADDIHVSIPYGRHKTATFDVRQAFPAGADTPVHLHKNLTGGLYAYEQSDATCNVRYVHFVDGSSWGSAND